MSKVVINKSRQDVFQMLIPWDNMFPLESEQNQTHLAWPCTAGE